ncbi:hypothetical protein [Endozoicomonas sp.]|uniref:hypothetical protein n=1 Tax=Endozoicomonas sp. TaxID=1892382 RepID=UPI003AF77808
MSKDYQLDLGHVVQHISGKGPYMAVAELNVQVSPQCNSQGTNPRRTSGDGVLCSWFDGNDPKFHIFHKCELMQKKDSEELCFQN